MRYVSARLMSEEREDIYRYYLTDCFYFQGQNKCWSVRFCDIINGNWKPQKEMNGDEVVADLVARGGFTIKE